VLCNPVLGNGSVNTLPPQRLRMQRENGVLSTWSAVRSYKEENWGNKFSWALQERLRRDGAIVELSVVSWEFSSSREAVKLEIEWSPLLKSVPGNGWWRQWLEEAVNCEDWRYCRNYLSINPFTNLYTVYSHIHKLWQ
jgi:hypothetical protein